MKENPSYKHGHCRRSGQSSEYMTWAEMIQRCKNPKRPAYPDYGARGISVCERWETFANFLSDMGRRPSRFTLERKNNDDGYHPGNCVWATRKSNNNNKRNNILLTHRGVTATAAEWSRMSSVSYRTFHKRIKRGWSVQAAIETP